MARRTYFLDVLITARRRERGQILFSYQSWDPHGEGAQSWAVLSSGRDLGIYPGQRVLLTGHPYIDPRAEEYRLRIEDVKGAFLTLGTGQKIVLVDSKRGRKPGTIFSTTVEARVNRANRRLDVHTVLHGIEVPRRMAHGVITSLGSRLDKFYGNGHRAPLVYAVYIENPEEDGELVALRHGPLGL
jgi:hypothetical protein